MSKSCYDRWIVSPSWCRVPPGLMTTFWLLLRQLRFCRWGALSLSEQRTEDNPSQCNYSYTCTWNQLLSTGDNRKIYITNCVNPYEDLKTEKKIKNKFRNQTNNQIHKDQCTGRSQFSSCATSYHIIAVYPTYRMKSINKQQIKCLVSEHRGTLYTQILTSVLETEGSWVFKPLHSLNSQVFFFTLNTK
jgi:hypothetical protein